MQHLAIRFILLLCFLTSLAFGESAYREPDTDYSVYEQKVRDKNHHLKFLRSSPLRNASRFNESKIGEATKWKSLEVMQERFEAIRDHRFLNEKDSSFPRRISWLYPKDGCWVRAALFNRNAFRLFIPVPSKVFAFGNLKIETPNSIRGKVTWWYHVAPVVQIGADRYVMDPSIEVKRPLLLKEWLERMGDPKKIKVSICHSGAYSPGGDCAKKTDGVELRALQAQKYYLKLEERELKKLGRDPEVELGENPPW